MLLSLLNGKKKLKAWRKTTTLHEFSESQQGFGNPCCRRFWSVRCYLSLFKHLCADPESLASRARCWGPAFPVSLGLVTLQRGLRGDTPQADGEWMQEAISELLCHERSAKKRWPARAAVHSAKEYWPLSCAGHCVGSGVRLLSPLCPWKEWNAVFFSARTFRNKYIHKKGNKGMSPQRPPNLTPYLPYGYLLCLLRSIKLTSNFGTVFMKHDYYDWQNTLFHNSVTHCSHNKKKRFHSNSNH